MSILTSSDPKYNVLDLGFDRSLVKINKPDNVDIVFTPEMRSSFSEGIVPKTITSGKVPAILDVNGLLTVGGIIYSKQYVYTNFESADGWTGGANLDARLGGSAIHVPNVSGSKEEINAEIFGGGGVFYTTKNPGFQCGLECSATTNQTIYFGVGDLNIGDGTENGFGFKIANGTLYALHTESDGVTSTERLDEITGITLTDSNNYKALYISNSKIEFYVNNILMLTQTTNLLVSGNDDDPVLMSFSVKTLENAAKAIYLRYALFFQDF